jgi:hypothetical protein
MHYTSATKLEPFMPELLSAIGMGNRLKTILNNLEEYCHVISCRS